jgi:hypothetical protein
MAISWSPKPTSFRLLGLHYEAAEFGNVAMAELLLKNGVDPLIQNYGSPIPINVDVAKGHTAVVGLLTPHVLSSSVEPEDKARKWHHQQASERGKAVGMQGLHVKAIDLFRGSCN